MLVRIIVPVLLTLALIAAAWLHFKRDRANIKLIGSQQTELAQLNAVIEFRDKKITDLNQEKKERNQNVLDEIAEAQENSKKAKAEAEKAKAEKAILAGQLIDARIRYQELMKNDQSIQAFSNTVVPDAVIDLLRVANGETNQ